MIHQVLRPYVDWHARTVRASMVDPCAAQMRTFQRLRRVLGGSEVASRSGFAECASLEDCRSLVTSDSASMRPLFQEAFERGAESGRLFGRSRLVGFARTSGTTGEPKDVPLNVDYLASLDRTLIRMLSSHVHTTRTWNTLVTGRRLLLGSRPRCATSPTGLPIGDISGIMLTRSWWSTRWAFIPQQQDLWIEDWPEKAARILEQARGKNVVSISAIPALALDFAARAREKYGVTHLDQAWPGLREYVYGAVQLSNAQKAEMRSHWVRGSTPLHFFETYFSTEGALAFSYGPDVEGLALNTLENLYLFRPYADGARMLFAHELQAGAQYSIHVTTPGGLVNYHLGDRVEVLSTSPLCIRVVGREDEELSLTGEKITVAQVDLALEAAGLGSSKAVVWVEDGEKPFITWAVPDRIVDGDCPRRLDEALCRVNVLYAEALQHEHVIGPSRVVCKPAASFQSQRPSTLGAGQFKPRRLFNSRDACFAEYPWSEIPSSSSGAG